MLALVSMSTVVLFLGWLRQKISSSTHCKDEDHCYEIHQPVVNKSANWYLPYILLFKLFSSEICNQHCQILTVAMYWRDERHWRLLTLCQNLFHEVFFHEHCRCEIQTLNQKCMFVTMEVSAIMSEDHVSHTDRCTLLSQNFQKWKDHAVNQQAFI
jgi:hypothetical protein